MMREFWKGWLWGAMWEDRTGRWSGTWKEHRMELEWGAL